MIACGMENGALWIIHPDTLEPMDPIPYKHSSLSIVRIEFSLDTQFLGYSVIKMIKIVIFVLIYSECNFLL